MILVRDDPAIRKISPDIIIIRLYSTNLNTVEDTISWALDGNEIFFKIGNHSQKVVRVKNKFLTVPVILGIEIDYPNGNIILRQL